MGNGAALRASVLAPILDSTKWSAPVLPGPQVSDNPTLRPLAGDRDYFRIVRSPTGTYVSEKVSPQMVVPRCVFRAAPCRLPGTDQSVGGKVYENPRQT